jgi:hypothetical protein
MGCAIVCSCLHQQPALAKPLCKQPVALSEERYQCSPGTYTVWAGDKKKERREHDLCLLRCINMIVRENACYWGCSEAIHKLAGNSIYMLSPK